MKKTSKMQKPKFMIKPKPDIKHLGEHSWAMVELHRWQTGKLPMGKDEEKLDISKALENAANALLDKDTTKWPSPMNIGLVLKYLATYKIDI